MNFIAIYIPDKKKKKKQIQVGGRFSAARCRQLGNLSTLILPRTPFSFLGFLSYLLGSFPLEPHPTGIGEWQRDSKLETFSSTLSFKG
jgi:hypothetical protein